MRTKQHHRQQRSTQTADEEADASSDLRVRNSQLRDQTCSRGVFASRPLRVQTDRGILVCIASIDHLGQTSSPSFCLLRRFPAATQCSLHEQAHPPPITRR